MSADSTPTVPARPSNARPGRRQPRDWLANPAEFGRLAEAEWVVPGGPDTGDFLTAQTQHQLACAVNARLLATQRRGRDGRARALAEFRNRLQTLGHATEPVVVRRKLRGETPITHLDLTTYAHAIGHTVTVALVERISRA